MAVARAALACCSCVAQPWAPPGAARAAGAGGGSGAVWLLRDGGDGGLGAAVAGSDGRMPAGRVVSSAAARRARHARHARPVRGTAAAAGANASGPAAADGGPAAAGDISFPLPRFGAFSQARRRDVRRWQPRVSKKDWQPVPVLEATLPPPPLWLVGPDGKLLKLPRRRPPGPPPPPEDFLAEVRDPEHYPALTGKKRREKRRRARSAEDFLAELQDPGHSVEKWRRGLRPSEDSLAELRESLRLQPSGDSLAELRESLRSEFPVDEQQLAVWSADVLAELRESLWLESPGGDERRRAASAEDILADLRDFLAPNPLAERRRRERPAEDLLAELRDPEHTVPYRLRSSENVLAELRCFLLSEVPSAPPPQEVGEAALALAVSAAKARLLALAGGASAAVREWLWPPPRRPPRCCVGPLFELSMLDGPSQPPPDRISEGLKKGYRYYKDDARDSWDHYNRNGPAEKASWLDEMKKSFFGKNGYKRAAMFLLTSLPSAELTRAAIIWLHDILTASGQ